MKNIFVEFSKNDKGFMNIYECQYMHYELGRLSIRFAQEFL